MNGTQLRASERTPEGHDLSVCVLTWMTIADNFSSTSRGNLNWLFVKYLFCCLKNGEVGVNFTFFKVSCWSYGCLSDIFEAKLNFMKWSSPKQVLNDWNCLIIIIILKGKGSIFQIADIVNWTGCLHRPWAVACVCWYSANDRVNSLLQGDATEPIYLLRVCELS
jgi:hypothetical protein